MINKIIKNSIKHKKFVFLLIIVLAFLGIHSLLNLSLDALPDISEDQTIIFVKWDQSADIIEDQITNPLVNRLLSVSGVIDVRSKTVFKAAWINIIFENHSKSKEAQLEIKEIIDNFRNNLSEKINIEISSESGATGWIYQYVLLDNKNKYSKADLRSVHDDYLKPHLLSINAVSEVASFGAYQKQLAVNADLYSLQKYNLSIEDLTNAVANSNELKSAGVLEKSGYRYMIRLNGDIDNIFDLKNSLVTIKNNVPILVKDVANVSWQPITRLNVADYNGLNDQVSAVVIMKKGYDVTKVITEIENKIHSLQNTILKDLQLVETYNRKDLIKKASTNITKKLIIELLVVGLIVFIFLMNIFSSIIATVILPIAILISMIFLRYLDLSINIMSLAGIAISMGAMVDAALVMIENCHKNLTLLDSKYQNKKSIKEKIKIIEKSFLEVAPTSFYSLMIIALSFLPVFFLQRQEGKLFEPLVYAKTFAMISAAMLSISFVPAVSAMILPYVWKPQKSKKDNNEHKDKNKDINIDNIENDQNHFLTRNVYKIYHPLLIFVITHPVKIILLALFLVICSIPLYQKLGSEFMPDFNEGVILYMPTTITGISVTEAKKILTIQNKILASFAEVQSVHGKAGRADTVSDPAPLSMIETVIVLKEKKHWSTKKRWYSDLPNFLKYPISYFYPEHLTKKELIELMDKKLQIPGFLNAWTSPIRARVDMLSTGIRTPIGLRIYGQDLDHIHNIAQNLEKKIAKLANTRSVFSQRSEKAKYLDITFDRSKLAAHGLSIKKAQSQLSAMISQKKVSTIFQGRSSYPLVVKLEDDYTSNIEKIKNLSITTAKNYQIYLKSVADIKINYDHTVINNNNGFLTQYVFIDINSNDYGNYIKTLKDLITDFSKDLDKNISIEIIGTYESMNRVKKSLFLIVPLVVLMILMLIYLNLGSFKKTMVIALSLPFSMIGVVSILYLLNYNLNIGVWIGIVALIGIDIETAMFMLMYLDISCNKYKKLNKLSCFEDVKLAISEGASKRLRPKLMTVSTTVLALIPILLSHSSTLGTDIMKPMVAPMVGGILSSFLLELFVFPAIYSKFFIDKYKN